MTDRIKQMLNVVRQDYGAANYLSNENREIHRSQRLNDLCDNGPSDIDFSHAAKFSYQSPRDPDTWKRPGHDRNWHEIADNFDTRNLDPVDAAMGAFKAARKGGRGASLAQVIYGETDHPKSVDELGRRGRQPKAHFPGDGKAKKKRGFFGLFRRKAKD